MVRMESVDLHSRETKVSKSRAKPVVGSPIAVVLAQSIRKMEKAINENWSPQFDGSKHISIHPQHPASHPKVPSFYRLVRLLSPLKLTL